MQDAPTRPVLFFSDVHLGVAGSSPERVPWLVELLQEAKTSVSEVYILGDLFDFWFEYKHAVPKGFFGVLRALADIADAGIPVTYLSGNHDYWVGSYLRRELGFSVFHEPIERRIQGRRIYLAHGDGLGPGDIGYRILKQILRNRVCIALYRILHPDIGIPLAHRVSAVSRQHTARREILIPRIFRDIALPQFQVGFDVVMMGHVHEPVHIVKSGPPSQEFLVIGDWLDHYTYVLMEEGQFRLMRRNPGKEPQVIATEPPPEIEGLTRS
jgi:UDP-2,3-diacylglucosamine hydrolase